MLLAQVVPIRRIAIDAIGKFFPHERGVLARRRLGWIEQRRASAPHHGWRNGAGLVVAHDLAKRVHVVEAENHHEGAGELRMRGARAVARRLSEIEVEREQRRQEIVAEVLRALAQLARKELVSEKIEKRLVRIERGGDEMFREDDFAVAGFDAGGAAALDQDAFGLRGKSDLAARLAHGGLERARQPRRAPARHLRLGWAREQRGDVMSEAAQSQIDFAQAVEEEQPGLNHGAFKLPFDEFERRERTDR